MQKKQLEWPHIDNRDYACVQVKRDIVVPPNNPFFDVLPTDTVAYYEVHWLATNGFHDGNRTMLFTFAGGVGEGTEYSGGVRQAIRRMLNATVSRPSDVMFYEGRTPAYRSMLRTSKFCIAPYGHGWGIRVVQAIEHGCIPLVIQDSVYQAFEDFLPYEDFSVRMPLADVPNMIELLRQYDEAELVRLRQGMARYFRAFIWDRQYGGRAYEWTLSALQRRVDAAQARHFTGREAGAEAAVSRRALLRGSGGGGEDEGGSGGEWVDER
ncbi:putative glycosyltransferase [Tetrabaena socialis]|uniref:Putative glycosyltransferase n=1 Tax=Tetrabaena socialis TaxID=47790 RepID=A0A2J7ZYB6_9CHLO|nr:putative glycosyltransferase [Tetrabaena socialis]|eukprot:PNH05261.1 putative glycosyltransferase [Tetrabaena socialis]